MVLFNFVTSSLQHQRIGEIVDPNGGDVFVGGFLAPDQQEKDFLDLILCSELETMVRCTNWASLHHTSKVISERKRRRRRRRV